MRKLAPWGFIGIGALACELFLYAASATFAPLWLVGLLILIWLPLMALGMKWFSPRPRWTLWAAVVGAMVWFVAVTALSLT